MPSVLNVDTLVAANGTDPVTLTKQSAAKAYWSAIGTSASINSGSLNTSGLTDNGVGDFTVAFSNSLSSASYSYGGTAGRPSSTDVSSINLQSFGGAILAGSYRYKITESNANVDNAYDGIRAIQIHGDLA